MQDLTPLYRWRNLYSAPQFQHNCTWLYRVTGTKVIASGLA